MWAFEQLQREKKRKEKCRKIWKYATTFYKVKHKLAFQTIEKPFLKNYLFLEIENSVYLTHLNVNNSYNITLHSILLDKLEKTEIDRKLENLVAKSARKLKGELSQKMDIVCTISQEDALTFDIFITVIDLKNQYVYGGCACVCVCVVCLLALQPPLHPTPRIQCGKMCQ